MPRDMLCYCLNLTYENVRDMWKDGYFNRPSEHHPGLYCTSCKGDLAWFLTQLLQESEGRGNASASVPPATQRPDGCVC